MSKSLYEYTWYQKSRLQAVEVISYWQGKINTRDIIEIFGISRQIAQSDMSTYLSLAPGNLSYKKSDRSYFATSIFKPVLTRGVIEEYLALRPEGIEGEGARWAEHVPKPTFSIDSSIFRAILQGIHRKASLQIHYQSLNHPSGLSRVIQPHTLVYSGFRWHVRAYCFERKGYRDFAIGRVMNQPEENTAPNGDSFNIEKDSDWNKYVNLKFVANPDLTKKERQLIESEFGIKKGALIVKTRVALINYTLQTYQVEVNITADNARRNRLVLENKLEIEGLVWK